MSFGQRNSGRFWGLLAAAFVIRLLAGYWWQARLPADQLFEFGDSYSYWHLGRAIAAGGPYQFESPEARVFRTPGYPLLLAPLFLVAGEHPPVWAARGLSALLGVCGVAAVYWLGTVVFSRSVGWVAAWGVVFYPGAIWLGTVVLSEAPFSPLMLVQLALWALAWQSNRFSRLATCSLAGGAVAAAATLMRPSWLLFTPFALAVGLIGCDRKRQLAIGTLMLAGLALGLLPWWIRNARVTGHFVPTTLQVGASLYDGLNPDATGASNMAFVERFAAAVRADQGPGTAAEFEYRLDRRLREEAVAWARAHPKRVVELAGVKFLRLWNMWPNEAEYRSWPLRLLVLATYTPLLVLGLCGAWQFHARGWPCMLCWLPAVYLTLLHVVFVSSLRYREPAMLALAVLAAAVVLPRAADDASALG